MAVVSAAARVADGGVGFVILIGAWLVIGATTTILVRERGRIVQWRRVRRRRRVASGRGDDHSI